MEDDVGSAVAASTKRVNSVKEDPTGKTGRDLREEIHNKIVKGQLLPPPKLSKPLPVPDSKPRRERGGRRLRKTKERYTITELRKLANIMQFALSEENALADGLGEGYGMYVQAGGGKLGESVGANKSIFSATSANGCCVLCCFLYLYFLGLSCQMHRLVRMKLETVHKMPTSLRWGGHFQRSS